MFWLQDYKLEFSEVSINYVYVMLICCPHNCCAHTCLSYCLSKSERQAGHSLRGGGFNLVPRVLFLWPRAEENPAKAVKIIHNLWIILSRGMYEQGGA